PAARSSPSSSRNNTYRKRYGWKYHPSMWLPILVSAVGVFILSSILHMLLPWHKNDFRGVGNEDDLMAALRAQNLAPGDYMIPRAATMAEMKTAEFCARYERGPKAVFTILRPGKLSMGPALAKWFVYTLVVSAVAALMAGPVLGAGADIHPIFHIVGLGAWLGYAAALWQGNIWYQRSAATTLRSTIDGLLYAIVTAAVFVWLWPH